VIVDDGAGVPSEKKTHRPQRQSDWKPSPNLEPATAVSSTPARARYPRVGCRERDPTPRVLLGVQADAEL